MNDGIVFDAPPVREKFCRHGAMMYLLNDIFIGRSLDSYGEYCQSEVDLFAKIIRPGMSVIDVGANIGTHTIYFASAVGPNGGVMAFEPQRHLYHMLCGNIALNGLANIVAHHAGLGRTRDRMGVPNLDYGAALNFGGVKLDAANGEGETVPVFALDQIEPERCHFIKVDVEGMERQVLEGAARTLARHRPVLYVENDRYEKSAELIRFLFSNDYRLYWHVAPLYNPDNFFNNTKNIFSDISAVNMLCIPKSSPGNVTGLTEIKSEEDWPKGVAR